MCDCYSFNARVDGATCHVPENSHCGAIAKYKWAENGTGPRQRFVEVEFDYLAGKFPGWKAVTRGDHAECTEKQIAAIKGEKSFTHNHETSYSQF